LTGVVKIKGYRYELLEMIVLLDALPHRMLKCLYIMSLTNDDKQWVVGAITEALNAIVMPQFDRLETAFKQETSSIRRDIAHLQQDVDEIKARLETLENDVRAIYELVADLQKSERKNAKDIARLRKEFEKKMRDADAKLHNLAAAAGIAL